MDVNSFSRRIAIPEAPESPELKSSIDIATVEPYPLTDSDSDSDSGSVDANDSIGMESYCRCLEFFAWILFIWQCFEKEHKSDVGYKVLFIVSLGICRLFIYCLAAYRQGQSNNEENAQHAANTLPPPEESDADVDDGIAFRCPSML